MTDGDYRCFQRSQEEYCDKATLEARLQAVARIMIQRQGSMQDGGKPGSAAAAAAAGKQLGALFQGIGDARSMPPQAVMGGMHPGAQQQMMGGNGLLPNGAPILRGAAATQGVGGFAGSAAQMMQGVPPGTMIPTPGAGGAVAAPPSPAGDRLRSGATAGTGR